MTREVGNREYVDVVCGVCGGYGVTMYPRGGGGRTKATCEGCGGEGHGLRLIEFWVDWRPNQDVLDLIAKTPAYREPESEER